MPKLACSIPGCNAIHTAKARHFPKVYFRRVNGKEMRVAQICMKCVGKGRRIET